ncbi:MAG: penicillin-binding transpeptidase domain-containing protein, partial [Patescibacteria group bacterium]
MGKYLKKRKGLKTPLFSLIKKKKINLFSYQDIEPNEIFLDKLAQNKEEEMGISEKKIEVALSQKTFFVFYFVLLILLSILLSQTFLIQVLEARKFSQLSDENKTRIKLSKSPRGVVYDSKGEQIVFNESSFDLVLDKRDLPISEQERELLLNEISLIIKENLKDLKNKIKKAKSSEVVILENIPHQTLLVLDAKIKQDQLSGFKVEQNPIRKYKDGKTFSHLIGYIGKIDENEYKTLSGTDQIYSGTDYIGKSGLEKSYETILRGKPEVIKIEKDVLGNKRAESKSSDLETGKSLALFLDASLQRKTEEVLSNILTNIGGKRGIVVALNPKTGGILALVSLPSFDNNLFRKGEDPEIVNKILKDPLEPLFNRVISGRYLTGSIIKPLIASAALQEKIISPEKKIYDNLGYIEIPHQYDPDITYRFHDWKIHGWADMRRAIAWSVNIYFYTIGGGYKDQKGLGPSKIKEYLSLFGWDEKTGIDLPGEIEGFVPDQDWKKSEFANKEDQIWYDGDTYNLSIGQGFLKITPLEVATSFAAIANGGKLLKPQVVKEVVDENKIVTEKFEPKIIRENFIDSQNLQIVKEGMRQMVTDGSG